MTVTTDRLMQRIRIHRRDGGRCQLCGSPVAFDAMHLDHVIPRSLGGDEDDENKRVACEHCNCSRGNAHDGMPRQRIPKAPNTRSYPPATDEDGVEVLTLSEAAERLELDRTTIFRQIKSGAIKAEKSGAIWLVDAREVERYRENHKGKHGKASPDYPHRRKADAQ